MKSFKFLSVLLLFLFSCSSQEEEINEMYKKINASSIEHLHTKLKGENQSFAEYVLSQPLKPDKIRNKIYIKYIANLGYDTDNIMNYLKGYLSRYFQMEVKIIEPNLSFYEESNRLKLTSRNGEYGIPQYEVADLINKCVKPERPEDAYIVLGLTDEDMYEGNSKFTYSYSLPKEGVGMMSTARLMSSPDRLVNINRIQKVITKQLVALFSLADCKEYKCCLNAVNNPNELDALPFFLCPRCLEKLKWNIGFKYESRAKRLASFWDGNGNTNMKMYYDYCLDAYRGIKHDYKYNSENVAMINADVLKNTEVSSYLEAPIQNSKSLIYCSSFQMAWNELRDSVMHEKIKLTNQPACVDYLNNSVVGKNDLNDDSYIAKAGFIENGVEKEIRSRLDQKFSNHFDIPFPQMADSGVIAFAYLFKNIQYQKVFDNVGAIQFNNEKWVSAFGIDHWDEELRKQVNILDYKNDDDFILSISLKDTVNELILSKIQPGKTLKETYDEVLKRIAKRKTSTSMGAEDEIKIPSVKFDLMKRYTDLEKLSMLNKGFENDTIRCAVQRIKFNMDKAGVILESFSLMEMDAAAASENEPKRLFFDKPYLIIMKQKNSLNPYFLMWVGNTELLD